MITYEPNNHITLLSTDTKPLVADGYTCEEIDIGQFWKKVSGTWVPYQLHERSLGAGTADSTKFLRGDRVWATPPGGARVETHIPLISLAVAQII